MRVPRALVILGCAVFLVVGGAVAYAAIPNADGDITACYIKPGGTLRISETGTCKKGETPIAWPAEATPPTPFPDIYAEFSSPTPPDTDTATQIRRFASCDPGDRVLDDQWSFVNLGGVAINDFQVVFASISTPEGSRPGKSMALETTAPIPDNFQANLAVTCLDLAAPFRP